MSIRNTLYGLLMLPFLAQPAQSANVEISVKDPAKKHTIESVVQRLDEKGIYFPLKVNIKDCDGYLFCQRYEPGWHTAYIDDPLTTAHELGHAVDDALQSYGLMKQDYNEFYDYESELLKRAGMDSDVKKVRKFFALTRNAKINEKGYYDHYWDWHDEYEDLYEWISKCGLFKQCFVSEYGQEVGMIEDFADAFALYLDGRIPAEHRLNKTKETDKKLQNLKVLLEKLKEKTKK